MDYYKILKLDKSCTDDMIKSAYRKVTILLIFIINGS